MVMSSAAKTFTIILYLLIFLVGTTGNMAVIYIFGIKEKIGKVFHIYIVSLAVADLLLALVSPLVTIHDLVTNLDEWKLFGGFGCKFFVSIDHVTMLVSASMLIIISLERIRYMRTDKRVSIPMKGAYLKISIAWLSSLCVVTPYTYSLIIKNDICGTQWSQLHYYTYYMVYISLSCFVPAIVIIIIQARLAHLLSTRVPRTVRMSSTEQSQCEFQRLSRTVVLISAMYFLLTMPYAIIHFLASYYGTFRLQIYLKYRETFETLIYIFHTLSHCNSFINPFIYAGMRTVKRIFRRSSSVVAIEHKSAENIRKTLL